MHVTVNGQPRTLDSGATIADLLQAMGLGDKRVAVEVNRHIVTRSAHASHTLAEGDTIEVVQAIGGG